VTSARTVRRVGPRGIAASPPTAILVLGGLGVLFFVLPFAGLLIRAPWSSFGDLFGDPTVRTALWLSLLTSLITTVVALVIGVPLAWLIARSELPGRGFVRALCTLSMVLPPVVAGVALFLALGRRGVVGEPLDDLFGVSLPFTTAAVVVAQLFVAMPFLVLTVEAALRGLDPANEQAARTLGASRSHVFRRVTLPSIRPALVSGVVLTWARALGEFGATITFAGSFPGTTRTVPLATYLALENDPDQAILLSLVLVAVSFAVLVGLRERWVGAAFGGAS
jgi:molybdate transport system permease protein